MLHIDRYFILYYRCRGGAKYGNKGSRFYYYKGKPAGTSFYQIIIQKELPTQHWYFNVYTLNPWPPIVGQQC